MSHHYSFRIENVKITTRECAFVYFLHHISDLPSVSNVFILTGYDHRIIPGTNLQLLKGSMMRTQEFPKVFLFALCFASVFFPVGCSRPVPGEGKSLRKLAEARSFFIGFATVNNFWNLPGGFPYTEIATREFNILTPENQLKWNIVHPLRDVFAFDGADRHVEFALANKMKVHGHCLVWHNQNPGWLTKSEWTKQDLDTVLKEHIDTVVGRYRSKIAVWDVVNEAFEDDGMYREKDSVWCQVMGSDYIEKAFRYAAAADPDAVLIYNDFNIEEMNEKSNAVYEMAADLVQRGVPIHGIGFQMHLLNSGLNNESFSRNMGRFALLGLDIYVTEMDVRIEEPVNDDKLKNQADVYRKIMRACLAQPACKALQLWGFTDKYSWIPSFFGGFGSALIYDENYKEKPAYFAIREMLATEFQ
jgi:endo-1,4-beta-xylanase